MYVYSLNCLYFMGNKNRFPNLGLAQKYIYSTHILAGKAKSKLLTSYQRFIFSYILQKQIWTLRNVYLWLG